MYQVKILGDTLVVKFYLTQIMFFFDINGYDILIKWCNHRNPTRLQNALEVAAKVAQSLNIRPYGSDNIGLEFYI